MLPYNFLSIATLSLVGLAVALISQHGFDMRPCAWCVFQRLLLIAIFVWAVLGQLSMRYQIKPLRFLSRLLIILTAGGGIIAAWYQHTVASQLFSCDKSFADEVMTQSGLESGIPWLFGIYATCMDASVSLFGLSYALWALLFFVLIGLIAALPLVNLKRQQ